MFDLVKISFKINQTKKLLRCIVQPTYLIKRIWNKVIFKIVMGLMWR